MVVPGSRFGGRGKRDGNEVDQEGGSEQRNRVLWVIAVTEQGEKVLVRFLLFQDSCCKLRRILLRTSVKHPPAYSYVEELTIDQICGKNKDVLEDITPLGGLLENTAAGTTTG